MKAFLSSTGRDLADFREAAFRSIAALGLQCVRMEDFAGPATQVEDFDERWIGECDLFFALVGEVHGSCPANSEKSYTELEYDAAIAFKKPCFVFLTNDDFLLPPRLIETDAKRGRQSMFRNRVAKGVIRTTFSTPNELAAKIAHAYNAWRNPPSQLPFGSPESIKLGYLEALITGCEFAPKPVLGGDHHKSIRLDSIYVPLHAYPGSNYEIIATAGVRTAVGATEDTPSYQNRKRYRAFAEKVDVANDPFAEDPLFSVSLILGDPGSGKTTLLYYRALCLAKKKYNQIKASSEGCKDATNEARFPIFVRAVEFACRCEKEIDQAGQPLTLLDFLGSQLLPGGASPQYPSGDPREGEAISVDELHEMLKSEVRLGNAEILIDGLDEVGDEKRRRTVSRWIDSFLAAGIKPKSPRTNIVRITSRIVGYEQAPLQAPHARFTVEPLNENGMKELAGKWFAAAAASEKEASDLNSKFLLQLSLEANQRMREMAENPHLLTLLCANFQDKGQFPRNRAELFRFLLDRNLLRPLLESGIHSLEVALRCVEYVAAWVHAESVNGRVGRDELHRELEHFLSEQDVQIEHTDRFLAILVERSGLMVERGPGEYAFLHRSLQEYLAGRHLLQAPDAPQLLVTRSLDTRWQEPVRLGLGHASTEFNRKRKLEPLLQSVLDVDDAPGAVVPTASLLLLDGASEMNSLPPAIIQRLFNKLLTLYCGAAGIGNNSTFEQLLTTHITEQWVSAELYSVEERAIEHEIEKQLSKGDHVAAQRAARLINQTRIYSDFLATALQQALHLDDASGSWAIHRCLQAIISQKKLQQILNRRSLPDDTLTRFLEGEGLKDLLISGVEIVEPAHLKKIRAKLADIHLSGLPFRDLLLRNHDLLDRIRRNPDWIWLVLCVYSGGCGDYEWSELNNVFQQASMLNQTFKLDTVVEPLIETIESIAPEFSPDLLYRDSVYTRELSELLKNGSTLDVNDFLPAWAEHLLAMIRGDEGPSEGRAAERDLIHRARELTRDCDQRTQIITARRISEPGRSIIDRARFWAPFLRLQDRSLADLFVIVSAIPELRNIDCPEQLIEGIGAASFCRDSTALSRSGLLWIPESVADYLCFALDSLEDISESRWLPGICWWLARNIKQLCAQKGLLFHYRLEIAARLLAGAWYQQNLSQEIVLPLLDIQSFPKNPKEQWNALLDQAGQIQRAYERSRTLIALHKMRPQHSGSLVAEAEQLVDRMKRPRDRAIVLGLLSRLEINVARSQELRVRGVDQASLIRPKEASTFLRESIARSLSPEEYPSRFWQLSEVATDSAAQSAVSRLRLPGLQSQTPLLDWVFEPFMKLLPKSMRETSISEFGLFFRLTRESLTDIATQSSEEIGKWLPLTLSSDPQVIGFLSRYADDGDSRAYHYALIAAENDLWSARGVGLVSQLLESENDAWRFRAQRVLEDKKEIRVSDLEDDVLEAVAQACLDKPHRTPLRWFFERVIHDFPPLIDTWCKSVMSTGNKVHEFLLGSIREVNPATWEHIASTYLPEHSTAGNALVDSLRSIVEHGLPNFVDVTELVHLLAKFLPTAAPARQANLIEILGYLGEAARDVLLKADLPEGAARCNRLIALGRIGMETDREIFMTAVKSADSKLRVSAFAALILSGVTEYDDLALVTDNSEGVIDAFAVACNTRFYSDFFRSTVTCAAKYIHVCSEKGDHVALNRLLSRTVSFAMTYRAEVPEEDVWRNERDFLPIAAAVAEQMPARFSHAWQRVGPPVVENLAELARTGKNFANRMAAIRLLGSLKHLYPDTVDACASGMFDHKYVRAVAKDVLSALPPVTAVTGESLLPCLQSGSLSLAAIAAEALHSALYRVVDEDIRRRWSRRLTEMCLSLITSDRAGYPIMDSREDESSNFIYYRGTAGERFGALLLDILGIRSGDKTRRSSGERFWMRTVNIAGKLPSGSFQLPDVALESTFNFLSEQVRRRAGESLRLVLASCREHNASVCETIVRMAEIASAKQARAVSSDGA